MKVCTTTQMRSLDSAAVERFGIPMEILMENAGQAVYEAIRTEIGVQGRAFVVFCGSGNNGGDGLVVARKIHSAGGQVTVFILGNPETYQGPAKLAYDVLSRMPVPITVLESADKVKDELERCDAVIDGIFGTGLTRDVKGIHAQVIDLINTSGKTVVSIDIPSGVNGDTGDVLSSAIKADVTVTFGLPKAGNLLYPGFENCGKIYLSHISFPPILYENDEINIEINKPVALPPRKGDAYKGDLGDVLFIAGAASYLGAPYFAAMSFLKAGGGYARLAAPKSITPFIASRGSEIVFIPQEETAQGSLALSNKAALVEISQKVDMVVIGPGLSMHPETQDLVRALVAEIEKPLIIDGDGLSAIADELDIVRSRTVETVLTPHLGEMSRLTKISVPDIQTCKMDILQHMAQNLKSIIVLKGAHSLIGYPDGRIFINMSGNSGMATAGSGDVLTGTVSAMFGLGLFFHKAVNQGVFIHGLAGDLAARSKGEDGMTAQDILENLPEALKMARDGLDPDWRTIYEGVSEL